HETNDDMYWTCKSCKPNKDEFGIIDVQVVGKKLHLSILIRDMRSLDAGYLKIGKRFDCKVHKYFVHRLIASAFCPKKEGKEYVNHIDGDSTNNKASNLEWCSKKENSQHAVRLGLQRQCGVKQMFDDGSCQEFPSLAEAQRITGIDRSNIADHGDT
ncbi:9666_t:CDS:2, partial [Diversispora eburnea]